LLYNLPTNRARYASENANSPIQQILTLILLAENTPMTLQTTFLMVSFGIFLALSIGARRASSQGTVTDTASQVQPNPLVIPVVPISDEPKSIDPAELLDKRLSVIATIAFDETSLSDVAIWVQQQAKLNVILDVRSLANIGVLPSEPVTDTLKDQPIYLLLDRLDRIGIGWRLSGAILYLHASRDKSTVYTVQYNIGDLLDQKFKPDELTNAITSTVDPTSWNSAEIEGAAVLLGDVLFVRQVSRTHRRVAGLLAALRKPSRRILIDDTPQHAPIRIALDRPTSVQFKGKSLFSVVDEIAKASRTDIRLDRIALKAAKISDRVPVTLEIQDQSLRTVLDLLVSQQRLSWLLRDGVLWITTPDVAEKGAKIAVYDVRDLCRNLDECSSLQDAIQQQSNPGSWEAANGTGIIAFATSGIMVVYQIEDRLDAILTLLENYRLALRNSKRRISPDDDPESIETKYYRMPTSVAIDLEKVMPSLLALETWKSEQQPNAKGNIRRIQSWDQPSSAKVANRSGEPDKGIQVTIPYSVLAIEQKRLVHAEIPKLLTRIEHGDTMTMGGMGGMGGFGGGMFSVSTELFSVDR